MKSGTVLHIVGRLLILLSFTLLLPFLVSLYYGDGLWRVYVFSGAATLSVGLVLSGFRGTDLEIGHKEGFAIVSLGWVGTALLGTLPYYWSGGIPNFIDAFFESMSGFTTTGSSILREVEALAPSLLFWRCLTHWIGGMGRSSFSRLPFCPCCGWEACSSSLPKPRGLPRRS